MINGESVVKAIPGLFDYSEIQRVVKAYSTGDFAFLENATITVLNATETSGVAQTKADELKRDGLTISTTGNAPSTANTAPIQLIDQNAGKKPETLKKLEKVLNVTATSTVPTGVGSDADFIIIVGSNSDSSSQN